MVTCVAVQLSAGKVQPTVLKSTTRCERFVVRDRATFSVSRMRLEMLILTRNSKLEDCDTLLSRVRSMSVGTHSWESLRIETLMDCVS